MQDFILLGQIPGTSIHINFGSWLIIALCIGIMIGIIYDKRHQHRLLLGFIYLSLHRNKRRMLKQFDEIAL